MWDTKSGKQLKVIGGHKDGVTCLEMSPDGSKLISGSLDSTMRIWDITAGKEMGSFAFSSQIYSVAVCPGDSWLSVGYVFFS